MTAQADELVEGGRFMAEELESQPDMWERAGDSAVAARRQLPPPGARVAVVGCGTSWFMAQSYAVLRESAGHGLTDAFTASEAPLAGRGYDAVIALTRSGTTTEVLDVMETLRGKTRTVGIVGDPDTALSDLTDETIALTFADERSVVQTRFATTALALLRTSVGHDLARAVADARRIIAEPLDPELVQAEQHTFLGRGWTVGLAHEAALKMREASQSWTESYPATEYRHGPISIASPGRVVWMLGAPAPGVEDDVAATGASWEWRDADPMAELVRVQRVALARSRARGLDADAPRSLTRSVILGR